MQVPTNPYNKVLFDPTVCKTAALDKQKNTLLTILTEYITKTTDKTTTITHLSALTPTLTTLAKPCSNC